jgi:hypothetical protein
VVCSIAGSSTTGSSTASTSGSSVTSSSTVGVFASISSVVGSSILTCSCGSCAQF